MPFDESLAGRVRIMVVRRKHFTEKRMFGGIGFLLEGHMCIGVWKRWLIQRLGPEQAAIALQQPTAREFDITGRALHGWVMIDEAGLHDDAELRRWCNQAEWFVRTLPVQHEKQESRRTTRRPAVKSRSPTCSL